MKAETRGAEDRSFLRWAVWTIVALLLVAPLVGMLISDSVNWSLADFALAGGMLIGAAGITELAALASTSSRYRAAVGTALVASILLIWINGGVGIIGSEDNPANLLFAGVLVVGVVGALLTRGDPRGMARAMVATALVQTAVAGVAAVAKMGGPDSPPLEILGINALFIALWLTAASLFRGGR